MPDIVTDTHALIWYLEDHPRLSPKANNVFDAYERGESIVYVPTICLIEIVYLQEKGHISATALGVPLLSRDRAMAAVEGLEVVW